MYIGLYCEQEFLKEAVSTKADWPIKIPRLWRGWIVTGLEPSYYIFWVIFSP